jgi:hypothetical protein
MKLPTARAVFVVATLAAGASWFAMKAVSQDKSDTGALYVDDSGEPQVVGHPLNPERVSLVRLISDGERYDGKEVVTQGFFVYAYEQQALYLSRDDAFHRLGHNGLILDGTLGSSEPKEDARTIIKKSHLRYVTISGTFHRPGRGHLNAYYAGELTDVLIQQVHREIDDIPPLRSKDSEKATGRQVPTHPGARARAADPDDIEIGLPGSPRAAPSVDNERAQPTELTTENTKSSPCEEYQASIVQILAHRDRYHGKEVQVKGFLEVEFEGTGIYLSKDDADYHITRNGFCVTFNGRAVPYKKGSDGPTQYHRKYVLIEGTFDKDLMGHNSAWQGAIKNVTRIVELTKHN